MKTPPYLRPWESLVESLQHSDITDDRITKRMSFVFNDPAVQAAALEYPFAAKKRICRQCVIANVGNLAIADVVMWRGDLFDAAVANSTEVFHGTTMHHESPYQPNNIECWIHDGDSPPSEWWRGIAEEASYVFSLGTPDAPAPDLALRAILVTPTNNVAELVGGVRGEDAVARWKETMGEDVTEDYIRRHAKDGAFVLTMFFRNRLHEKFSMPYVMEWHLDQHTPITNNIPCSVLAALAFCKEEFVRQVNARPEKWKPSFLPTVKYHHKVRRIVLRRIVSGRDSDESNDPSGREYSCQWIVGGHWRRLHEPRKADGAERTYVRPYVKGPADKPLVSRVKVAHVKR